MKVYSSQKDCQYLKDKYEECLKISKYFVLNEDSNEPIFLCEEHAKLAKKWGK